MKKHRRQSERAEGLDQRRKYSKVEYPRLSLYDGGIASTIFAMAEFGKILAFLGVVLLVLGGIFLLLGRTNLPFGRLPGDILYRGKNTTFYFPLTTSLLLSAVLSIVLYIIGRLRH